MPQAKLSKRIVQTATCPADKSKISYSDTQTKGLTLEVRRTGGRTFYFRYHDAHGRQKNVKIGDASTVSVDVARQKAADLENSRALGNDPAAERQVQRHVPRLDKFFEEMYLPYVKGYKVAWDADDSFWRNHIKPAFGRQYMDQISKYELAHFMQAKRDSGLKPSTANRFIVLLRYVYNLALEWEVPGVKHNPAKGIKLFYENNKKERFLSEEEVKALVAALRESENPDLENIIGLLLMTGARKSEALKAEWSDIDFERRLWRVPKSKSGSARHIPLSDGALRLLESLPSRGQSRYLFPNPKTGKPYQQIFHSWDTARKRAGIPDVRLHDLRHSFASFLINSGRSLYEVQKILGHHSISITERYSHLRYDRLREAASAAHVPELETATG
jgi:integrase